MTDATRRAFLTGAGGAALASAALAPLPAAAAPASAAEVFYGPHQAGVVTAQQGHAYFAAFDLTTTKRVEIAAMLRDWTQSAAGLAAGIESPARLPSLLFKVRAGALLSGRQPDWSAGYLSGLLIGAEVGGQRDWIDTGASDVPLVGSPGLCGLYQQGLALLGVASHIVDAADATLAGLRLARELAA